MAGLRHEDLLLCFVALAVILVFARGLGALARAAGQPEVVGELFAGIVLGPSSLGALAPAAHAALFSRPGVDSALSAFSWMGAVLLLLIAGTEVDLQILRREARAGASTAAGSILVSIAAGAAFATWALRSPPRSALFLGLVLSVSAVTVVARLLIEREALRRRYAQVTLAAGIASEIVVWPLISMMSAARGRSPWAAIVQTGALAVAFFAVAATLGRRFAFRAMRWVSDTAGIVKGQISLVLVLLLLTAAATMALGLHPLLGAFVVGVLLRQAPRTDRPLLDGLQTLTSGLFAPVFFALAGMRVDVRDLRSPGAWLMVLALFVVASVAKVLAAAAGARIAGMRGWEAVLVGVGVDLKGGTDVIVAIIGVELGVLSPAVYTMYAVVAVATVLVAPLAFSFVERRAPPSAEEATRLQQERAAHGAYTRQIERVLVPVAPRVVPICAAELVERVAAAKRQQNEIFDVTELVVDVVASPGEVASVARTMRRVRDAGPAGRVQILERHASPVAGLHALVDAARGHDLVAIGARVQRRFDAVSFGRVQDAIVRASPADVVLVIGSPPKVQTHGRILVPVNGLDYSTAAADIAAHVAVAADAELVLMYVACAQVDAFFWSERDHARLRAAAMSVLDDVESRVARLHVRTSKRVQVGQNTAREVLAELRRESYQLVALGSFDRGTGAQRPALGPTVDAIVSRAGIPALVLVSHRVPRQLLA